MGGRARCENGGERRRAGKGVPRALSSTGAALMSSAKGSGMRWKPAGSCHPSSSTFSAYR